VDKIGAIIDTIIEEKYHRGTLDGSISSAISEITKINIAIAVNTNVNKEAMYSFQSHKTLYIKKSLSSEKFLYLSSRLAVTIRKSNSLRIKIKK